MIQGTMIATPLCGCVCHGSGTAFAKPCDIPGGCHRNHRVIRCGICNRRPAHAGQSCFPCRETLGANITDLIALYDYLPFLVQPAAGGTTKVSGTRTPPLPGNINLMDFIGPGNPTNGPMPLRTALVTLEHNLRVQLGHSHPAGHRTIPAMLTFLKAQNVRACATYQPVGDYHRSVMRIYNTLRDLCGEHRPSSIGRCPALPSEEHDEPCGARLYASTYSTSITCRACGTTWDYAHWQLLGAQMGLIAG